MSKNQSVTKAGPSDRSYDPPLQLHKGPLFQAANTVFISKFSGASPQFPWRVFIGPHFKSNDPPKKNLGWVRAWKETKLPYHKDQI